LLKLGKFSIYAAAGVLTARAVSSGRLWARYEHCLLAAGVVIAAGLVTIGQKSLNSARPEHFGYKASNAISVLAAMFACYCLGSWLQQRRSMPVGRKVTLGLVTGGLVLGAAISQGRGGWVGGAAGLLYICYRRRLKWQTLAIAICVPTYVWLLYTHSEAFRHTAYATLFPEEVKAQADFAGMDTGGRLSNWIASVKQFQSPVFGTGFFHRGASSGLWENGSHNFFLQMFLETGIPGGVLMLLIIRRLWRLAGMGEGGRRDLELPIKAALVAAIVGGMSGEYLYGGPVLLALFAMCPVAGAPRAPRRQRLSAARPQWNKTAYPASSF
jgi:O-antigen ligase